MFCVLVRRANRPEELEDVIANLVLMAEGPSDANMHLWLEDGEELSPYARMIAAQELPYGALRYKRINVSPAALHMCCVYTCAGSALVAWERTNPAYI